MNQGIEVIVYPVSVSDYVLYPIGFLQSPLKDRGEAPRQGGEGAPNAWLEVHSTVAEGLEGIAVGDEINFASGTPRTDQKK